MVLSPRSVVSLAVVVAFSLLGGAAVAAARQAKPAGPAQFQGELVTVNVTAKTVTVKSPDGASQQFGYTDATEISGAASNAEGLAAMRQAKVTVHYTEDPKTKSRLATRIVAEGRG